MQIDPWILAFSAVTVIATIWVGFWSARRSKTAHDFYVAGRSVSVGWNASAISGEYLSAASFMGVAGMVMSSGYDALWYPVCYACGYLFLLLFIAGPLRRFGAYTIPDFAEGRYDSPLFRKIAVVFVLFIGFFYTMPQMKGAGVTLAYIFPGLPYWVGVVLVGAVITLNVALGGMKGITLVQAFQYWAKMFAISVPIFVLMAVYGDYGKQLGLQTGISGANQGAWDKVFRRISHDDVPYYFNGFWSVAALKLGLFRTTASRLPAQWTVEKMAAEYASCRAAFGRRTVYVERSIASNSIVYPGVPKNTLNESVRVLGGTLRSNAIVIQEVADRTFKFFPAAGAVQFAAISVPELDANIARRPLPEKAPADSTWLSPFGPLTTKAAKAAAATLTNRIATPSIPLRADLAPDQRMTVSLDSPSVAQVMGIYADLTGRRLLPRTNSVSERIDELLNGALSRFKLVKPAATPDSGARFHADGAFTAAEVKAAIEAQLRTNGLVLVPEGNRYFRVETGNGADFDLISKDKELWSELHPLYERTYGTNLPGQLQRLKDIIRKPPLEIWQTNWRSNLPPTSLNILLTMQPALQAYGAASGKAVRWQRSLDIILPFGLNATYGSKTTDAEMAAKLELALHSQGVALVNGPRNTVVALYADDLKRLQDRASANSAMSAQASIRRYALIYTYSLIIALVCGTAGLPHILVRFYTNPDGVAAKRTTMWVMIFIGVFYLFPPIFGVLGRNLMPELYNGLTGVKGTDGIVLKLPTILRERYGMLGSILSGVTCAGAFAAFMSTFSGLLVSMTGALAHDVFGRILKPKSTPEQRLRAFKVCAALIGGIAILLGCFVEPLEINFMVGQAFAIAAASYFPLLFMSVWWRGMTMRGAATGMLTGGLCALAAVTLTNVSNLALDKGPMGKIFAGFAPLNGFWAHHPLLRILCEQPAIWTVPLAIGLMIVVGRLTSRAVPTDIRMKMLVLHAPEKLGLKQEYIQEHQAH